MKIRNRLGCTSVTVEDPTAAARTYARTTGARYTCAASAGAAADTCIC